MLKKEKSIPGSSANAEPLGASSEKKKSFKQTKMEWELRQKKAEKMQKKDEKKKRYLEKKAALETYKNKKAERFKVLSKKNKKGQPVMAGRMEILYEKIKANTF